MNTEVNWIKQINSASRLAKKFGFETEFKKAKDGVSEIDFDKRHIVIHTGHNVENQFYCILHELGHYLIANKQKSYCSKLIYCKKNFSNRSLTSKISLLDEELRAWELGMELAKTKRWKIDKRNYTILRSKFIKTYVDWIARG